MTIDNIIKTIIENTKLEKYQKLSKILKYLFVDLAKISQQKYYILGSFGIREHRPISDLDINIESKEFYKLEILIQKGFGKLQIYNNQIRWFLDMTSEYNDIMSVKDEDFSIEAFQKLSTDGFPNSDYSLCELKINNKLDQDENGHQFFNIQTLLDWKNTMGRPKDLADVKLIEAIVSPLVTEGGGKTKKVMSTKKTKSTLLKKGSKKSSK